MDSKLSPSGIKFFEKEDRAYTCGKTTFHLMDSSLKGEHALVAPYGVRTYEEKSVLPVIVPDNIRDDILALEKTIQERMIEQIPGFISGCQQFHSNLKTNEQNETILTLKLSPTTLIESYDVKKGSFSKLKLDSLPAGSKVSIGFTLRHPWKYSIDNNMKYGVSFSASDIVVFNDGSLKRQLTIESQSIKDLMLLKSKKKTKMMTLKEEQAIL